MTLIHTGGIALLILSFAPSLIAWLRAWRVAEGEEELTQREIFLQTMLHLLMLTLVTSFGMFLFGSGVIPSEQKLEEFYQENYFSLLLIFVIGFFCFPEKEPESETLNEQLWRLFLLQCIVLPLTVILGILGAYGTLKYLSMGV